MHEGCRAGSARVPSWLVALAAGVGHTSNVRPDPSAPGAVGERGSHHESCWQLVSGNDANRLTRHGRPMTLTGWAADCAEELLAPLRSRGAAPGTGRPGGRDGPGARGHHRAQGPVALRAAQDQRGPPDGRGVPVRGRGLAERLAGPGAAKELVFAGPQGGALRVTLFRRRFWLPATQAAGLAGLRIDDLRHTAVRCGSPLGRTPRRSRAGPAMPR